MRLRILVIAVIVVIKWEHHEGVLSQYFLKVKISKKEGKVEILSEDNI